MQKWKSLRPEPPSWQNYPPFKAWGRSECSHPCFACYQDFVLCPNFCRPGPVTFIFFLSKLCSFPILACRIKYVTLLITTSWCSLPCWVPAEYKLAPCDILYCNSESDGLAILNIFLAIAESTGSVGIELGLWFIDCFWLGYVCCCLSCVWKCNQAFNLWFIDLCCEPMWRNFECAMHPEVTLRVWRDAGNQEITNQVSLICMEKGLALLLPGFFMAETLTLAFPRRFCHRFVKPSVAVCC